MTKSKIAEIVNQVKSLEPPYGYVEFFNTENRLYATLTFRNQAVDPITDEIAISYGYIVDYQLPRGNFTEEYNEDNELDKMIIDIYNAEQNSYQDFDALLLDFAQREGEQTQFRFGEPAGEELFGNIEETLKINYDHNLRLWVFETDEGKIRVEDKKHLAVQILRDFHNAVLK